MQKLLTTLTATALIAGLSGCSVFSDNELRAVSFPGVYKIDIQQGNVVDQKMIDQLRPQMSKGQVLYVMGTPLLKDTFEQERWDYLYSYQPGGERRVQQVVSLYFENNQLAYFKGDFRPEIDEIVAEAAQLEATGTLGRLPEDAQ